MRSFLISACLFFSFPLFLFSQHSRPTQPKIIVGIVVDQMRYDYLYKYWSSYGEGGFKRLLSEGYSCENTHYNYMPTYTGPGHAAIYTGTTPSVNGVVANIWWDREWADERYVTSDPNYLTVGSPDTMVGQHSPKVLLSSTITDELRLSNNFRSKVVGVCIKDRGSILPAGHIPNACYWFDDKSGNWITSSYYTDSLALPEWVTAFNDRKLAASYLGNKWSKLPGADYSQSFENWDEFKGGKYLPLFKGGMPYDLAAIRAKMKDEYLIRFTPFGNRLTLDFALEAVEKMELGKDEFPDFLCLSFSCTDYIGHQFGVHAEETQDAYLKLDKDLTRLLSFLDQRFGKDNALVFLTADHGAAETPAHLKSIGFPVDVFEEHKLKARLDSVLLNQFGNSESFVLYAENQQVWLNWDNIQSSRATPEQVEQAIIDYIRHQPGVYDVFSKEQLSSAPPEFPFVDKWRRGIHPQRSGDISFQLQPGWHGDDKSFKEGGTTHGTAYAYDTHVPLVWYGWHVKSGETYEPVDITDIAPTIAAMLRIMEPNGTTGKVILPLMR